ncbi:hypothetical protein GCM10011351_17980 [Paraliobacillus quinghaiensis]|uniref:Polysaccharide pyruvyl transferase domain-containing protein n=1 Tax=Paraliobacillus quinghaiensis TaxID=470815 RepID=A0A917TQY4_9BACI|nr:polysaccharide pyruvyl transferase family protein [Paraliobacillus quinghaiensis]GGM32311.1 hypothetical protein GCM10011351_17980 [Paraliobacillus quinghaiensis]
MTVLDLKTEDKNMMTSVVEQRSELRNKQMVAKERYRILYIGRAVFGETDIVNRMRQALENLGHVVFNLNTKEFKKVVHNPQNLVGGHGPIEIKLGHLKPILSRFKPQIIICNAGGYTFSEADTKWLKANGFILIGITLSDPDVFEGTQKFVHRFDYHVTNAHEAIDMYKTLGIDNTFHFPFAIDRSFVEADAMERRDWNADVICIGNAANRPDRNEFMSELNHDFNVKVYGTGWDIPGSFSVGGEDFFSAARAGNFHVNFPGTRAGFTNVKVGVFESIANGGIICTEYFKEMEHFFEYDKEIIGYKDVKDLKEKIKYYLDHPEEAELIRRRAFDRLVKEHLWEARWEQLFSKVRTDLRELKQLLPLERYNGINLEPLTSESVKIIVQGYYGAKNVGDDLILEAIYNKIIAKYPEAMIMVAGFSRENITLLQGFYSLPRTNAYEMEKYIKDADLVIYGGGGLLNDYTFNNSAGIADYFDSYSHGLTGMGIIPTIANIHNVPVMYFALGVGPLENPEARKFVRFMTEQIDIITVRDSHSKQLLESIDGMNKEVIQTADPTLTLPRPNWELAKKYFKQNMNISDSDLIISVSLREWKSNPANFTENIAKYLDELIITTNATILFIPFQFAIGRSNDNNIHLEVYNLMKYKENAYFYEMTGNYDEFLSIISAVDLGINMRLHGSILQNLHGVPTIGFNYDDKVKGHFDTIGMVNFLLNLDFNISEAVSKVLYLEEHYVEVKNMILNNVNKNSSKANESFEFVYELIQKGLKRDRSIYKSYPRSYSLREKKSNELTQELKNYKRESLKYKKETIRLRKEIAEIKKEQKKYRRETMIVKEKNDDISCVNLSDAKVQTNSSMLENVLLPVKVRDKHRLLGIRLPNKTPKKGDYSSVIFEIPVKKLEYYQISTTLNAPYERPKNKGRIRYEIFINNKKVYKEDIAIKGDDNELSFNFVANSNNATLELKVIAIQDCEEWSWGNKSKVYISDVNIKKQKNSKYNSTFQKAVHKIKKLSPKM